MAAARASAMAGHSARAVEVLTTGDGRASLRWIPGAWRGLGFEALAMAYADLGRDEDAARTVAEAEAHAAELGLPTAVVWAARAAAVVALRAGDAQGAAERALVAAEAADSVGVVIEAALSRLLAGRAFAAVGDEERAVAELERAADTFAACGALPHRDAAEQELRRMGRRVYRRTRPGATDGEGLAALTGASCRSPSSSPTARPTRRSPASCSSARRRSRPTCATSSARSA